MPQFCKIRRRPSSYSQPSESHVLLSKIHFSKLLPPSNLRFPKYSLPFKYFDRNFIHNSHFPMYAACPAHKQTLRCTIFASSYFFLHTVKAAMLWIWTDAISPLTSEIPGSHSGEDVDMVLWVLTSCNLIGGYRLFGRTYLFHLQGEDGSDAENYL